MTDDIGGWLDGLGLGKYSSVFVENEIDLEALPYVTDEALEKIGVALGARLKILAAIAVQPPSSIVGSVDEGQQAAGPTSGRSAERRRLTVMFCDLVGSTALSVT